MFTFFVLDLFLALYFEINGIQTQTKSLVIDSFLAESLCFIYFGVIICQQVK